MLVCFPFSRLRSLRIIHRDATSFSIALHWPALAPTLVFSWLPGVIRPTLLTSLVPPAAAMAFACSCSGPRLCNPIRCCAALCKAACYDLLRYAVHLYHAAPPAPVAVLLPRVSSFAARPRPRPRPAGPPSSCFPLLVPSLSYPSQSRTLSSCFWSQSASGPSSSSPALSPASCEPCDSG